MDGSIIERQGQIKVCRGYLKCAIAILEQNCVFDGDIVFVLDMIERAKTTIKEIQA